MKLIHRETLASLTRHGGLNGRSSDEVFGNHSRKIYIVFTSILTIDSVGRVDNQWIDPGLRANNR